ncbi:adenylylsulfate kinase [Micractinium conductrix]|uniref:Adenylyl-sulfate kinase n=1 Tax=Micractinium conductrix TaxID=554055 RepID=A0A2P6VK80_9CHLO|nr:adenylylsulfate kinase [Micractinium conductrix]|eukprot:PSC74484.1 adenylylsulfate kinase [Micractinium conductrix]
MLATAARRISQQCGRTLAPMAAASGALQQQVAGVTSGPAGAVYNVGKATNIKFHDGMVPRDTKEEILGQKGVVLWFTGLSGSGKSTVACTLEHALAQRGRMTVLLDGDNVRHGLNKNLGFTAQDREENIRRIGEVSKLFAESGVITLTSFISPYRKDRESVRARMADGDFLECYMRIPIELCEQRDPKGLYKAARAGKIKNFTGIDDPYEEPDKAEIVVDARDAAGNMQSAEDMAATIMQYLEERGYLSAPAASGTEAATA